MKDLKKTHMDNHVGTVMAFVGLTMIIAGFFCGLETIQGTLALFIGGMLTMSGLFHRQTQGRSGREFELFFLFAAAIFFAIGSLEISSTPAKMWYVGAGVMVVVTLCHRACRGPSQY